MSESKRGFDLNELNVEAADEGVWMQLEHPADGTPLENDQGQAMRIKLAGRDSERFKRIQRRLGDRRLSGKKKNLSFREAESEALNLLANCTLDWEGIQENDEPVEFTDENVKRLYQKYPWIKDQVDEFITDRTNFLGKQ